MPTPRGSGLPTFMWTPESPKEFLGHLRTAVTVEDEQRRADAIASEIRSLRQLIQCDVDGGLVDGGPSTRFVASDQWS